MINNKKWYVIFAISKTIKYLICPINNLNGAYWKFSEFKPDDKVFQQLSLKRPFNKDIKNEKKNLKRFIVCTCVYTPIKWYNTREMYWSNCVIS